MRLHGSTPIFNIDDFAKTKPEFSFSRKLNKVIFMNKEAFWLCVIAAEEAGILDGVPFGIDDDFARACAKEMKINNKPSNSDIKVFLIKKLKEAMDVKDNIGDDAYKCFKVDPNDKENVLKMQPFRSKDLRGRGWTQARERKLGDNPYQ